MVVDGSLIHPLAEHILTGAHGQDTCKERAVQPIHKYSGRKRYTRKIIKYNIDTK